MAAHRFWLLEITAVDTPGATSFYGGNPSVIIGEIELRGTIGGADLTDEFDIVTASSTFNQDPAYVIDNGGGGYWDAGDGTSLPQWVKIDAGVGNTFNPLELFIAADGFDEPLAPTDFNLTSSDDDVTYAPEGSWTGETVLAAGIALAFGSEEGGISVMSPVSGTATGLTGGNNLASDVQTMLPLEGLASNTAYGSAIGVMQPIEGSGSVHIPITIDADLPLPTLSIFSEATAHELNEAVLTGFNTTIEAYSGAFVDGVSLTLSVDSTGTIENIGRVNLIGPTTSIDASGTTGFLAGANLNKQLNKTITAYSGAQVASLDGFNTEIVSNVLQGHVGVAEIPFPKITIDSGVSVDNYSSVQIRPPNIDSIYGFAEVDGFITKITAKGGFSCDVL